MKRGPKAKYTPEEARERALASMRKAGAKWRANNPRGKYHKAYDSARAGKRTAVVMFQSARYRAQKAGLPFELIRENVVIPDNCPVCGVTMLPATGVRGGSSSSPTLDRIIGDKGYVLGNIAVICKGCNSIKGKGSAEEHRRIAEWMDANTYFINPSVQW